MSDPAEMGCARYLQPARYLVLAYIPASTLLCLALLLFTAHQVGRTFIFSL